MVFIKSSGEKQVIAMKMKMSQLEMEKAYWELFTSISLSFLPSSIDVLRELQDPENPDKTYQVSQEIGRLVRTLIAGGSIELEQLIKHHPSLEQDPPPRPHVTALEYGANQ
jgi:hypothetical protein